MYFERLARALPDVRARIAAACERAGRGDPERVLLVAVTKGHPADAVRAAHAHGLRAIGENRVQEGELKRAEVSELEVEWHLVGHLQRNKVRRALRVFDWVQSVDSVRLGEEIDREAEKAGRRADVLVEVNASGEPQKYGLPVDDALPVIAEIARRGGLRVRGLMTMAPLTQEEGVLRSAFRRARECFERCRDEVPGFDARHLSMGMSNDYPIAVEEGATMVRIGTALFGPREGEGG